MNLSKLRRYRKDRQAWDAGVHKASKSGHDWAISQQSLIFIVQTEERNLLNIVLVCLSLHIQSPPIRSTLSLNMFSQTSAWKLLGHWTRTRHYTTCQPHSLYPAWWLSQILMIRNRLISLSSSHFRYAHPHQSQSTYDLYYFFRHIIRLPHTICLHNKIMKARTVYFY